MDLPRLIGRAEDWLRRNIKSKAVKEAERRRRERRRREAVRRAGRALVAGGGAGAAAIGIGAAAGAVVAGPLAAAIAAAAAGAALLWPSAARAPLDEVGLVDLVAAAEEWLLLRRGELPGSAIASIDLILERLDELRPRLAALDPAGPLAGEARRLVGRHLPGLVDSWTALPPSAREEDPAVRRRLAESLATCAAELRRLCEEASKDRRLSFDVHHRFIESRYRDGDGI